MNNYMPFYDDEEDYPEHTDYIRTFCEICDDYTEQDVSDINQWEVYTCKECGNIKEYAVR